MSGSLKEEIAMLLESRVNSADCGEQAAYQLDLSTLAGQNDQGSTE
jgi:hypothetical protein